MDTMQDRFDNTEEELVSFIRRMREFGEEMFGEGFWDRVNRRECEAAVDELLDEIDQDSIADEIACLSPREVQAIRNLEHTMKYKRIAALFSLSSKEVVRAVINGDGVGRYEGVGYYRDKEANECTVNIVDHMPALPRDDQAYALAVIQCVCREDLQQTRDEFLESGGSLDDVGADWLYKKTDSK